MLVLGVGGYFVWKKYFSSRPTYLNSLSMRFVQVPAGAYRMGSPTDEEGRDDDEEQQDVEFAEPFWIGMHEVTQEQFTSVMGYNPSVFQEADHPVENVTWEEAVTFCRKLSELPQERNAGRSYRLPTEAEWEYACRAGKQEAYAFAKRLTLANANFAPPPQRVGEDLPATTPVGKYSANAWGIHDMHGNVWEWCQDWYKPHAAAYPPSANTDEEDSGRRVVRGGSRADPPVNCRSAKRRGLRPTVALGNGFRVVMETH